MGHLAGKGRLVLLDADRSEELVRQATASERTARAIGRPFFDRSGGNPQIILEMVDHLLDSGQLVERDRALELAGSIDEIPIPSSVADLVALKLDGLDPDERRTLVHCAVLGFEFVAAARRGARGEPRRAARAPRRA